jgi:hypothetical protein
LLVVTQGVDTYHLSPRQAISQRRAERIYQGSDALCTAATVSARILDFDLLGACALLEEDWHRVTYRAL